MPGPDPTPPSFDTRRRRLSYRAWHRGTREMDLIFGLFCDAHLAELTDAELSVFEELIDLPDNDLYTWVTGEAKPPAAVDTPLFRRIVAFHTHPSPRFS